MKKRHDCVYVGVDEAGRGALAGPVVAAACMFLKGVKLEGLNDSKKLSKTNRTIVYHKIVNNPAVRYCIATASHGCIERKNILQASLEAMKHAVEGLFLDGSVVILVDGINLPDLPNEMVAVKGGDGTIEEIMAASILAKCYRDTIMEFLEHIYPMYSFSMHKGYGTERHFQEIFSAGLSNIHRPSFCKRFL